MKGEWRKDSEVDFERGILVDWAAEVKSKRGASGGRVAIIS